MYIATDSDGRITAMTDRKEFAIGMREVTLPDDFDNTKISDYIVSSDGTVTYSKKPETNEEKIARKQAEQSQQFSTAVTMFVLANASSLTDKQLISVSSFFPDWEVGHKYTKGEIINYNGKLYRCLQDHKSQTTWDPADAPSLWAEILPGQSGDIGEWVQPGSTNTYMKGDKVTHNGKTWTSDVDNNVWEPGVYGWTEYSE